MSKIINAESLTERIKAAYPDYGVAIRCNAENVTAEVALVVTAENGRSREVAMTIYGELKAPYSAAMGYAGMLQTPALWGVEMGVSWASLGTVTSEFAAQFGRLVLDSTAIAGMIAAEIEKGKLDYLAAELVVFKEQVDEENKVAEAAEAIAKAFTLTTAQHDEIKRLLRETVGHFARPQHESRVMWSAPTRDALVTKGVVTVKQGVAMSRKNKAPEYATLTEAALTVARQFITIE